MLIRTRVPSLITVVILTIPSVAYADGDTKSSTPFYGYPVRLPGTLRMAWFDKGGEGVAYHDCDEAGKGGDVRQGEGVDIGGGRGNHYLGWLCTDEWLNYSINVTDHAAYRIEARVASAETGGAFRLEFYDKGGKQIAKTDINVPGTGDWTNWRYVYGKVRLPAGPARMRFVHTSGERVYNVERIRFRRFDPFDINRDGEVSDADMQLVRLLGAKLSDSPTNKRIADLNWAPADRSDLEAALAGWRPVNGDPLPKDAPWKLKWSDEFDKNGKPDPAKWKYELGYGFRNNEKQNYTDDEKNAYVKDGHLIIEAIREKSKARDGRTAEYSSASLYSAEPLLYGRIEVRAKLPTGRGMWPAIWMLADRIKQVRWPRCGEIDIMENVGYDPNAIHGSVHTQKYNHTIDTQQSSSWELAQPWADFHVYAIEWSPERIDFYIDRVKYMTFANEGSGDEAWPFDKPHKLKLNIAVGGMWGGVKGVDDGVFPQKMIVDYVRAYERK
ncbi:MAG: family 16 glycosylhydrolase [Phycisphaerales bacterium]|nr:family 16 glycosylhydrolase [Phycisphaerales bacterium]MCB9856188.1 family 16 glycosylhydrolase [Phycisphaerales bacterium]MCB9863372.1 family 16 glycosylhydrolase [Phycisphaerales bacterium]